VPPRYAYWTILIDKKPTAFRARLREELLPTVNQLRRTNTDVTMMWFARGRLWESPEQERDAWKRRRTGAVPAAAGRPDAGRGGWAAGKGRPPGRPPGDSPKRGRDWRPGGKHEDPRARFDKRRKEARRQGTAAGPPARPDRPRADFKGKLGGRPPKGRSGGRPPGPPHWRDRPGRPPAEFAGPARSDADTARRRGDAAPELPRATNQGATTPKPPKRS
jgi:hypothetical protein